ncbi:MAG: SusC/RagA family TonB-linked outer membrane protein, partial [Pricia sp.]
GIDDLKFADTDLNLAQQSTLQGTVTDAEGLPLPGANVVVKGTTRGVVTDFDGNFSIEAEVGETLEISYIGFEPAEITLDNMEALRVSLEQDAESLDEVVVVGYGTQKRKDLTGSIARVNAEDFSPGANTNAVQLLNGAAAGVNVSQISSAPGGGIKIQVRGAGSINSSNNVLFVVDGLPGVDPNSLSPDDIESIDVLKDASAASIYGTRAANGVVLITTKQGKGEPQLSYSRSMGMQAIEGQLDGLGASDYQELVNLRAGSIVYSDAEIAAAGEGTNWQDEIFRSAPIQNHQISLSGGGEKSSYYLGLNYFEQDGVVKSTSDQKYNVRLNVTSNPFERLKISTNLNFTRQSTDEVLFSNAANDFAGPINTAIQFDPSLPAGLNDNGRYFMNPNIALDNPVALVEGITDEEVSSRFYGSLTADLEVIKNVTATLRLGAELKNGRTDFYRSRVTQIGLSNGGDGGIGSSNDNPSEFTHWLAEYLLKYENTFNEKHDFSILGGATFEEFLTRRIAGSSAGFLSDVTGTNLLQSGDGELRDNVSSSKTKNQLNGFLGRITYGFDNRYLLTASIRVDGSSRFSDANKYGFFPSASLGWRVSEESFFDNVEWFN